MLRLAGACLAIATLGALGAAVGIILSETVNRTVPIKVNTIREIGGVTYAGGRIQIYQNIANQRGCPATVSRWLWTYVTYNHKTVPYLTPITGPLDGVGGMGATATDFILSFPVPTDVFNGTWYYLAILKYQCGRLLPQLVAPIVSYIGLNPRIPVIINDQRAPLPRNMQQGYGPP
jgi:hypothetical protein